MTADARAELWEAASFLEVHGALPEELATPAVRAVVEPMLPGDPVDIVLALQKAARTAATPAPDTTPGTPDDRLRELLAEAMRHARWIMYDDLADALLPVVAAEVETRVHTAARQQAAKMLREAADWIWDEAPALASASAELHARADHLAALAQPAPGDA